MSVVMRSSRLESRVTRTLSMLRGCGSYHKPCIACSRCCSFEPQEAQGRCSNYLHHAPWRAPSSLFGMWNAFALSTAQFFVDLLLYCASSYMHVGKRVFGIGQVPILHLCKIYVLPQISVPSTTASCLTLD
jgi:hypothetical protein